MKKKRLEFPAAAVFIAILIWAVPVVGADQPSAAAVTASRAFKLSGYVQSEYTAQDVGIDGFSIHRARLALSGDITDKIHFKVQADLAKSPVLLDAAIEFAFHDAASLRVGQFKVPFSMELLTSASDLDTIDRSQAVSKLAPGLDIGASGRDIGAVLFGKISILEYSLGVFNGAGINKADTNNQKDRAGRIVIRPFSFLSLGASYYDGSYSASASEPPVVRDRIGFEAAVLYGNLSLKGEYIQAEDNDTTKRGWYLKAGYFFLPNTLQGVVKFDSYDSDTSAAMDRTDIWILGLNWFLAQKTKLQVNFDLTRDESNHTTNKTLLVQFQAGF